jgi:hypothetical protein
MEKCGYCNSTNLEYLPDVDGASWVRHTYKQKNGKWIISVTGNLSSGKNEGTDNVSKIDTRDIHYNDSMAFFYCVDCTAELHARDLKLLTKRNKTFLKLQLALIAMAQGKLN